LEFSGNASREWRNEEVVNPSIGRIVRYKNTDSEKEFQQGAESVPAVIVRVFSETCVMLTIFQDSNEMTHRKTSVMLGTDPGTWSWPAFDDRDRVSARSDPVSQSQ
jgi:hypothetical protein